MEKKSEITTIPNQYKDTLNNHINSSDIESLNQSEFPDKLAPCDSKCEKAQYEEGQRSKEDGKYKRNRENRGGSKVGKTIEKIK